MYRNLWIVDESVLNEELCLWLKEELGMERFSGWLLGKLKKHAGLGMLVLPFFREIGYLPQDEYRKVEEQIAEMEKKPHNMRQKLRADSLAQGGLYLDALRIYEKILDGQGQGSEDERFYAAILNNMAAVYVRMFCYEEAADCLWRSYGLVRSTPVYRRYLALLAWFMTEEDYRKKLEEMHIPAKQIQSIEKEKEEAIFTLRGNPLLRDMDYEELCDFLRGEKQKYRRNAHVRRIGG